LGRVGEHDGEGGESSYSAFGRWRGGAASASVIARRCGVI
jgi:hypothetical protein